MERKQIDMEAISETFLGMATGRRLKIEFIECDKMHEDVSGWAMKINGKLYGSAALTEGIMILETEMQRIRAAVKGS